MWKFEVQQGQLNSCFMVHQFTEETDTERQNVLLTAVYKAAPKSPGVNVDPRHIKSHYIWSKIKSIEASTLTLKPAVHTDVFTSHVFLYLCFDIPIF